MGGIEASTQREDEDLQALKADHKGKVSAMAPNHQRVTGSKALRGGAIALGHPRFEGGDHSLFLRSAQDGLAKRGRTVKSTRLQGVKLDCGRVFQGLICLFARHLRPHGTEQQPETEQHSHSGPFSPAEWEPTPSRRRRRIMNFKKIADELYALPLDVFVASRDARANEARKAKKKDLVKQIKALTKPTQSAWYVNQLVRQRKTLMERLFKLGKSLRKAQESLDGELIRKLTAERHELLRELAHATQELGDPSESIKKDVLSTLEAALTDEQSATLVQSGQLTQPLQHSSWNISEEALAKPARKRDPKRDERKAELRERLEQEQQTHDRLRALVEKLQADLQKARSNLQKSESKLEETRAESERLGG